MRGGQHRGSGGQPFPTVINIGIGGSDLGPAMAVEALHTLTQGAPRVKFVSNVDGTDLANALEDADPATTLFIIASKTFTTQETLANARSARAWLAGRLGEAAVPAHFAAVSTNAPAMDAFGVNPNYRFVMWDWVGGRYSMWSSIGVSLAIAIGRDAFLEFLAGGHAMDEHFRSAPWDQNLPVLMGCSACGTSTASSLPTLAVLPYDGRLKRFPAYLQQLDMESNGKSVDVAGNLLHHTTAPVIWGEAGNNAQHSFFQMLHQGTPRARSTSCCPRVRPATTSRRRSWRSATVWRRPRPSLSATRWSRPPPSSRRASCRPSASNFSRATRSMPATAPSASSRSSDSMPARWVVWSRCTSTRCSRRAWYGESTPSISGAWSSARKCVKKCCRWCAARPPRPDRASR